MKKAAAKGSKAEQKAKKKQVEEEISRLSAELKERQATELASLGYATTAAADKKKSSLDGLVNAIAGVSVDPAAGKSSKSTKRREKRAQQEAERERRIAEEQSGLVSDRSVEDEKLRAKLAPLGLAVAEVKPDGHCLYRALEAQLGRAHGFQELREMAARYMRAHAPRFVPFFIAEKAPAADSGESPAEMFERYCGEVEGTAAWGGHLELEALTHCLRRHVVIFSGSFPDVEIGKEYKSDDSTTTIRLSFHKHAFGLGEHYNSVVPI